MRLARAIILQSAASNSLRLRALVDQCLDDGVALIAICGKDAFALEAEVDWQIIGDGPLPRGLICTSAHIDDDGQAGLSDAISLAGSFSAGEGVDHVLLIGPTFLKYRAFQ